MRGLYLENLCSTIKTIYSNALNYTNNIWYNSILTDVYSHNDNDNVNSNYYIYDSPNINVIYNNDDQLDVDFVCITDDNTSDSHNMHSSIIIE